MSKSFILRKNILLLVDQIPERYQIKIIRRMLDDLEELESFMTGSSPAPRGNSAAFYRAEIDWSIIPETAVENGICLQDYIETALSLMETYEVKKP